MGSPANGYSDDCDAVTTILPGDLKARKWFMAAVGNMKEGKK